MTNVTITFKPLGQTTSEDIARQAAEFFQEWTAEGGLTDALNPAMRASIGMEAIVTGSGLNQLEISVIKVQSRKQAIPRR